MSAVLCIGYRQFSIMTEVKIYYMIFNCFGNTYNAISNNGSKVGRTERGFKTLKESIISVVTVKVNTKEM